MLRRHDVGIFSTMGTFHKPPMTYWAIAAPLRLASPNSRPAAERPGLRRHGAAAVAGRQAADVAHAVMPMILYDDVAAFITAPSRPTRCSLFTTLAGVSFLH
jgi:4-amino-4-deoxy-L-arabinose transferase-like glycosyltransferase